MFIQKSKWKTSESWERNTVFHIFQMTSHIKKGNYILLDPEDFYMNCFGFWWEVLYNKQNHPPLWLISLSSTPSSQWQCTSTTKRCAVMLSLKLVGALEKNKTSFILIAVSTFSPTLTRLASVGIHEKHPNRNASLICSTSPLDWLLLGMNWNCARWLNGDFFLYSHWQFY